LERVRVEVALVSFRACKDGGFRAEPAGIQEAGKID
jgi:hypothetical protein